MAEASERPVLEAVLGELRPSPEGLKLPDLGEKRVIGLVEMAAHHPDEAHGAHALVELMRLVVALENRKAPAGRQLRALLAQSPAALHRLDRRRSGAPARERLARALGERVAPRAPSVEQAAPGLSLKDLGQFRRLDPDAVRAKRRG